MLRPFIDAFWNEDVWLPSNTTWSDVAPGPDKSVTYTDHRDLFIPIPLALVFIALRYVLERYIYAPFGRYLGIKDSKPKKLSPNPKLEAAYRACPDIKQQLCVLAKKLDMTEREVERWWRIRRSQDKPSTLIKFCENMFKFTYYFCNFSFGIYILWDKEWLWDIDQCYIGYPHQGLTSDVWWYYMISSSFFWSLTLSQFWDVRRKDFWQMFVHHIATVALLSFSWLCNLHRIGSLVLPLHDISNVFVESLKAAKYARYQKTCDTLFFCLVITWISTRVVIFPFYIIWSTAIRASMLIPMFPALQILNLLLCLLLALHIVWTYLILQMAYKAIKDGQVKGDIRSSSSELSDSSNQSNNKFPTYNNNKNTHKYTSNGI